MGDLLKVFTSLSMGTMVMYWLNKDFGFVGYALLGGLLTTILGFVLCEYLVWRLSIACGRRMKRRA